MRVAIIGFIHYKWGSGGILIFSLPILTIVPLVIQLISTPMTMYKDPLTKVLLLRIVRLSLIARFIFWDKQDQTSSDLSLLLPVPLRRCISTLLCLCVRVIICRMNAEEETPKSKKEKKDK